MNGNFAGGLGFGLAFVLHDKFTDKAKGIKRGMGQLDKSAGAMSGSIASKLGGVGAALGLGFSFAQATRLSAELSDQMVGVAVSTGMSNKEMEGLRSSLEAMDTRTELPELLGLSRLGSQLGVANQDLAEFTKTADNVGIVLGDAFGGAEGAVTKIGKISKLFNIGGPIEEQLNKVGSAIDVLNDKTSANIGKVTAFATKMGELGKMGPTIDQALGLGTALDELGVKSKGMASQIAQIFTVMGKNDESMAMFAQHLNMTGGEFKKLFAENPNEMLLKLAESFKDMESPDILKTMTKLKIGTPEAAKVMSLLGNNIDKVRLRQQMASQAFREGTSVSNEAAMRNQTFAAQLEKIQRNFKILLTRIGDAISQGFAPFLNIINGIIKALSRFAASPVGKATIKYTAYFVGFGAAVLALAKGIKVMNGALKMATRSAIRLMIALWPVALIAAPILIIVATIQRATKAFSEFDGTVKKGIGGMFQRFGGIIAAVREIWSTWDSATQTFTVNNKLMEKLKALGIDKWAIKLGTYIVRLKEFFSGMVKGLYEGFQAVYNFVKPTLDWIIGKLEDFGIMVKGATDQTSKWAQAGKVLGFIIIGMLVLMALPFVVMGILIAIVVGVIYLLYTAVWYLWEYALKYVFQAVQYLIQAVVNAFIWLFETIWYVAEGIYNAFASALSYVGNAFKNFFDFIGTYFNPINWVKWGIQAIQGLWKGIKSAWGSLKSWLGNAVKKIPVIGAVIRWWQGEEAKEGDAQAATESADLDTGVMEDAVANKAMGLGIAGGAGTDSTVNVAPQTINLTIDGEKVGEAVANYNENETSRE